MSNTHKQSKGYPHHASSGLSNTPSGVQPNHQYSTPSNKATYFEGSSAYGGSSDDTLPLTPTSKTTSAAQSTPHHQTIQGNPTSHHKATSTSDEVKKDSVPSGAKIGDDADAGSGSTVTSAYLKSEGADSTLQDAGKSEAQAKYPLPKRSATPSDLSAEERPNHQDTSSEKTGKNQDNAKAKPAEKTAASQKTVKRKADGGPRRYDGAKESAPSSDRTIASDASDDEEESFDPTTFVAKINVQADLIDRWNEIQAQMAPELKKWAEETIGDTFTMVYSVVHIFHLMNNSAQKELREGVANIEAEENKQEQYRRQILQFSAEMEKVASSLRSFPA